MALRKNRLTDDQRRRIMQAVRGKNTKLEILVRRLVHGMGYRFRLHRRDLPGSPDLVFGPKRKAIFVHGCFWHHHQDPDCGIAHVPASRREYWLAKLNRNAARDKRQARELAETGWRVLVLWECETINGRNGELENRIKRFLE